ncbi:MAG: ATP-binding protein, partial [Actinomycetes bacterium]
CAAVDRFPLGIELAAGLTRTLSTAQLARRIDGRLRLLVGGGRDRGGRHSSLRAALDWSYELLAEPERVALRRAAVFEGGYDLDAAELVLVDTDPDSDTVPDLIDVGDVAPALTELVDRNLLTLTIGADGSRRFGLLEMVRDYALAHLAAAAETDAVRTRHLRWCLEYVRALGSADDFASADAVRTVFEEWPNLLTALDHAPGTSRGADGLRLANALNKPWFVRGAFAEARRHFTALTDAPGAEPAERGWALARHGLFALMSGGLDESAELLDRAAAVADGVGDDALTLTVRFYQGVVATEQAKLPEAIVALHAGYTLASRAGIVTRAAAFADAEGRAHRYSGNADAAVLCARTALAASRSVGDDHGASVSLGNLA